MSKYIRCDYCNKVNNINEKTLNNPIITGYTCLYCSEKLDTKKLQEYKLNNNHKLHHNEEEKKNNIVLDTIKLLIIIAILIFATIKYYDYQNSKNDTVENNYSVLEKPKSGIHLDLLNKNRVAPFTVITNGYSNYYIKLKSLENKQKYITIFINKGDEISTKVPLGRYILTYTNGEEWYGVQHLFGKKSIQKAEKVFSFTQNKQVINGHTVTLYNVVNGNLQKTSIAKNSF